MLRQLMSRWGADECAKFEREAGSRRDHLWHVIHDAGVGPYLSPHERDLAESTMVTMTERQQVEASWRMEAAQVFMWALGLLPALPPYDTIAKHELLKQIPSREIPAFIASARLRGQTEIDRARSAAELWHWRSRTRFLIERGDVLQTNDKLKAAGFESYDDIVRFTASKAAQDGAIPPAIGDDFPVKGKAYRDLTAQEWPGIRSITAERHFALNWLCGYAPENRWDETPTGT